MAKFVYVFTSICFFAAINVRAMAPVDFQYYLISRTLFEFRQVKTTQEFVTRYARDWKVEDRAAFLRYAKNLKRWPESRQEGTVLVLTAGKDSLRVDFREIARKIVYFGTARVELNHHETYLRQIERALAQAGAQESALYRAFVPEARALPQMILIPLAFVGVAIANKLVNRYGDRALDGIEYGACYLGIEHANWDYMKTTEICAKYIEAQKKIVAENPSVLAAKPALVDTKPAESPIKTAGESCGQIGDASKGKQEYRAVYQVIKENLELRVSAEIDGLKLGKIEMSDAKSNKTLASFKANADNTLSEIRIPNPKRTSDSGTAVNGTVIPSEIALPLTGTIEDPELSALRTMYLRVYQHFGDRLGSCKSNTNEMIAGEAKKKEERQREAQAVESRR